MKKIVTLFVLASFLLVGVVGCGGTPSGSGSGTTPSTKKDTAK